MGGVWWKHSRVDLLRLARISTYINLKLAFPLGIGNGNGLKNINCIYMGEIAINLKLNTFSYTENENCIDSKLILFQGNYSFCNEMF